MRQPGRSTRVVILAALALSALSAVADDGTAQKLLAAAEAARDEASSQVIVRDFLKPALAELGVTSDPMLAASVRIELAGHYRRLGRLGLADETLRAIPISSGLDTRLEVSLLRERAQVSHAKGEAGSAVSDLRTALDLVREAGHPDMEAVLLNDLGILQASYGDANAATESFDLALATAGIDPQVHVSAAINRIRVALRAADATGLDARFSLASEAADRLPTSHSAANAQLAIGTLYRDAQRQFGLGAEWRRLAFERFEAGLAAAREVGNRRLESFGLGYIGSLYADELRWEPALRYARQAAFAAQSADADDALYRWQWQAAQALRELGAVEAAIVAYRQSISTLERLKADLGDGPGPSFRERAAPVFFELADLLLTRTATLDDAAAVASNLREVRTTLEQVKVAEVQEYFQDQCVRASGPATELDMIGADAAIIYPILLPERTELLVSLPSGLRQFTTPVGSSALTEEVRQFRREIERYDGELDYLRHANNLYRWLVEPLEAALAADGIETLVFVPDGPLRTIPMSALHDGERFLVERFAFATTPGLTLTSPQPLQREEVQMLVGGLTQGVQGFSPLPNVGTEIDSIRSQFPAQTLRDEEFVVDEVRSQIAAGNQAIVHIATHGQFDSDHSKSFLLAYDDKLTMDRLQTTIASRQYQEEPLELLVLSACQTAAGDDRAALGLAGVALKAGARSALATLWFVNDESTSTMIADFYEHLRDPANSKAIALQRAQVALVEDSRFAHPSYWAPFLLIGNWL